MIDSAFMQWTIISLAVAASLVYAIRRLAPGAVRRARTALALIMLRPQRGPVWRRLGRWFAPTPASSAAASCGGGSCKGCSDTPSPKRPLQS